LAEKAKSHKRLQWQMMTAAMATTTTSFICALAPCIIRMCSCAQFQSCIQLLLWKFCHLLLVTAYFSITIPSASEISAVLPDFSKRSMLY
jgi:hypothetical protein